MKPYGFFEGDRSEYLAAFAFSTIGYVIPVPRQSDQFLCDFFVHLVKKIKDPDGKGVDLIIPTGLSFGVQIKSNTKPIIIDGADQLHCMHSSGLPFFVGIVDKKKQCISIYHTMRRLVAGFESPEKEIHFIPESDEEPILTEPALKIGLGKPIVSFTMSDLETKRANKDLFFDLMRIWTITEFQNLAWRLNQIPWVMFPQDYVTNELCKLDDMGIYWAGDQKHTPKALLGSNIILMGLQGHLEKVLRGSSPSAGAIKSVNNVLKKIKALDSALSKCTKHFP
jgi:hypothetical protein